VLYEQNPGGILLAVVDGNVAGESLHHEAFETLGPTSPVVPSINSRVFPA